MSCHAGRAALAVLAVWAALPALAQHQNQAQGFRPEHVFDVSGLENVNLFNGNLTLTIPIGGSYPLGPELSYGLVLTWSGNLWDWEETQDNSGKSYLQAQPRARNNAGFGWELSLGRIIQGSDPDNTSNEPAYMGPDQALHPLVAGPLHSGGESFAGVRFSRDSTYLRRAGDRVEFPHGTIRTFSSSRLDRLEDRFGNNLAITYTSFSGNDPLRWDLTDSHGRSHSVQLAKVAGRLVLTQVQLATFGSQPDAKYTFTYASVVFPRPCNEPVVCSSGLCGNTSDVTLPVLTKVQLPDGSAYSLPESSYYKSPASCVGTGASKGDRMISGHPQKLELPTGGAFEYDWKEWRFPDESGRLSSYQGAYVDPPLSRAAGLAERRRIDRSGNELGSWTYSETIGPEGSAQPLELEVTVVQTPRGEELHHFFSVWPGPDSGPGAPGNGWSEDEYGLPFTRSKCDRASPPGDSAGRWIGGRAIRSPPQCARPSPVRLHAD